MGMENCIPNSWEREWKWTKSFPNFGNGNGRPVFPGMVGNGNSRSPLEVCFHEEGIGIAEGLSRLQLFLSEGGQKVQKKAMELIPAPLYAIKRMSFALIEMLETFKLYQKRSCNAVLLNLEKYLEHVEASL